MSSKRLDDELREFIERSGETVYAISKNAEVDPGGLYRFCGEEKKDIRLSTVANIAHHLDLEFSRFKKFKTLKDFTAELKKIINDETAQIRVIDSGKPSAQYLPLIEKAFETGAEYYLLIDGDTASDEYLDHMKRIMDISQLKSSGTFKFTYCPQTGYPKMILTETDFLQFWPEPLGSRQLEVTRFTAAKHNSSFTDYFSRIFWPYYKSPYQIEDQASLHKLRKPSSPLRDILNSSEDLNYPDLSPNLKAIPSENDSLDGEMIQEEEREKGPYLLKQKQLQLPRTPYIKKIPKMH